MKKIYLLSALAVCFCGFLTNGYADGSASSQCANSSEEEAFMAKLSDVNKALFCAMTETQRSACMKMTEEPNSYGHKVMPDEAVQNMSTTGGCAIE